jgi:hypothetical protein
MRRRLLPLAIVLALPLAAHALHRSSPGAILVTTGAPVVHPSTRSWERYLAFSTTEDLLRTGSAGRQVYLFNLFAYDCANGLPGAPELGACPIVAAPPIARVTTGVGDADDPSVDRTGTVIAFAADGAYGGGSGAAVGHRQIFVQSPTAGLVRVTTAGDGDSARPSLNERGGIVAFESTSALLGPGGTSQIFLYDLRSGLLRRLTSGAGPSTRPMLNRLGTTVAFESTADLRGDGHDTGISQIFWFDVKQTALHQLTSGNASSRRPWLASKVKSRPLRKLGLKKPAIFFESDATDLGGGGTGTQVYAGTTRLGDLPTIIEVTPVAATGCTPGATSSSTVSVDASGRHLSFVSTGDLLCNGTTGARLFVLDMKTVPQTLYQVTGRGDVAGSVAGSLGLWFVSFTTTDDVTGAGVCGSQLHVVDFFLGRFGAATTAGQVPLEPPTASADLGCDDADACTADVCDASVCQHAAIPSCP